MVMPSLLLLLFSLVGGKLEEGWRVVRHRECQDEEEYMCRQLAPSGSVRVWCVLYRYGWQCVVCSVQCAVYGGQCAVFELCLQHSVNIQ